MADVLNNNRVLNILRGQGYKSISFDASMFEVVYYLKDADVFHQTPGTQFSLYQNELINMSVIRAFNRRKPIVTDSPEDFHRRKILEAFRVMETIPEKNTPYYVHGHVLAPHQPVLIRQGWEPGSTRAITITFGCPSILTQTTATTNAGISSSSSL